MNTPHFWQSKEKAQKVIVELSRQKEEIKEWEKIHQNLERLKTLAELLTEENDPELAAEFRQKYKKFDKYLDSLKLKTILQDKYDSGNVILSLYAGAGGVDAQDWTMMLLRMYLRYCERKGWRAQVLDQTEGNEAGIKSVTLEIKGHYAYGYLKNEAGVHRLVRLSPFDADKARHTSFALVEVLPEISPQNVKIRDDELKIETFRSAGAGGQSVNKTSSAVRVKHLPTGLVVQCQNERSQLQNKETALKILRAKLEKFYSAQKEKETLRARGEHVAAGWGNQIRSYVLHPYKLVKDHRTGYEIKNTDKVLDGEIDNFIQMALEKTESGIRNQES